MQDGFLTISVINASTNRPIPNATINIYGMNDQQENTGIVLQNLITDESGQVRNLTLSAPNIEYSLEPSNVKPYSEYIIEAIADGFETVLINGTQILPVVEALQNIPMGSSSTRKKKSKTRQNGIVYDPARSWMMISTSTDCAERAGRRQTARRD